LTPRATASTRIGQTGFLRSEHTTGNDCLYIKKLADVDQHLFEALDQAGAIGSPEQANG